MNGFSYKDNDENKNLHTLELCVNTNTKKRFLQAIQNFQKLPQRPFILKLSVYKNNLFGSSLKYLVVNPDEGTLIIFECKKDYPLKPKEIIPID